MMKMNNNGFSAVEGLLIFVVIGIIAGAGIFVYKSQKATNQSLDNASSSLQSASQAQETAKSTETKEPKFFVIKELGVKFELTTTLQGLYYHLGNEGKTAYFSLEELKGTDCAADQVAQVALTRYTDEDFDKDMQASKNGAKKIGSYYYISVGGQAACSEDDKVQDKALQLRSEVLRLLPNSLESIE